MIRYGVLRRAARPGGERPRGVAVIRRRSGAAGLEFSLNGGARSAAGELLGPYRQLHMVAAAAGVAIATVVVVSEIRFDNG